MSWQACGNSSAGHQGPVPCFAACIPAGGTMPAPSFTSVPVVIVPKGPSSHPKRFTTLPLLECYFPQNTKHLVVPASEVAEYRRHCKGKGITVLGQPGQGLADAERFACSIPELGNR